VSRDPGVPNARPARVRPRGDTWGGCARNHRRDSTVRQAPNLSRPVAAFSVDRSGRTNWCRHVFVDPTVRRPRLSAECRVPSAECECRMPRARARARAACRVPSAECECRMPHAACACACRVPSAECECGVRVPHAACRVRVPSAECRVPSAACRVPSAECHVPRATCRVRSAECRVRVRVRVPSASASARRNALHKTQLVLTNVLDPRPIDATSHRTNVARRTNRRRPHRTLSRNVRGIIARSRGCSSRALRPRLLALEHVGRPRRVVHSASNNRGIESRVGDSRRSMLVSS